MMISIPHKDKMVTGSCLLWKGESLLSELVRIKSDYSHASLVVRFENEFLLRNYVFLIEAYEHGLEFNNLEHRLKDTKGTVDLFIPEGLSIYKKMTIFKTAFLLLSIDKGYDLPAILKSAIQHPMRDPTKFICSEFVDYVWITSNLMRKVENPYAAWPGDIPRWWNGEIYPIRGEDDNNEEK